MSDDLILIATVAGIFSVMDSLTTPAARTRMSEYIFGVHGLTARQFEDSLMSLWLSLFMRGAKVSWLRASLLSVFITLVIVLISYAIGGRAAVVGDGNLAEVLAVFFWMSLCGAPIEYLNLRISKYIYITRGAGWPIWAKLGADLALSLGITGLSLTAIFVLINSFPSWMFELWKVNKMLWTAYVTALVAPLFSVAAFLGLRAVVLAAGGLVRAVLLVSNINLHAAMMSNAANVPLTYLALLLMGLFTAAKWLIALLGPLVA